MTQKATLQYHFLQIKAINLFLLSYYHHESIQTAKLNFRICWIAVVKSQKFPSHSLTAYLTTLINYRLNYISLHSVPGQSLFPSTWTFVVIMSLSLISDKLAFLHDGYIATIENYWVPMVVKHTLFATYVASLLLGIFRICYVYNVIVIRHLIQHKVVATELHTWAL